MAFIPPRAPLPPLSHTRLTRLLTRKEKGARGKMGNKEIFLKEDLSSSSFSDVLPRRERLQGMGRLSPYLTDLARENIRQIYNAGAPW